MQENRVMTEAEMALAKATGARSVTIKPELRGFDPEMTQEEFEEYLNQRPEPYKGVSEVIELREKMNQLVTPLNTSHLLPLWRSVANDLEVVQELIDLKRQQLVQLEEAHYNLKRQIRQMGLDPKELG